MSQAISQSGLSPQAQGVRPSQVEASDRPLVWVNGKVLPKSQAMISVYDHGLLYGDGIFEGIRVYNGKIFKSEQHMDRLYGCAEKLFIDIRQTREEMVQIQRDCIEINGITDGYIRLIVTRGEGTLGLNPYTCAEPGVICIADTIQLFKDEMYSKGMRVVVANRPRIPIACLDPRVKSLNYLNNILAKCEAIQLSKALKITKIEDQLLEVVMLNMDGKVSEGSGDNIFIVKDGVVITPPIDAGILEGITRRFVINELCPAMGVKVEEKFFGIEEMFAADEMFLTGSAAEMIAVREVLEHEDMAVTGTHQISDGEGPVTKKLRTKFREIVTSDNVPED
ncbi:MAG: branched-chain amino acid aminotransferase [Phycisphaerales bacterium]|jgi:branched-chain amino acid aminotransferase